MLKAFCVGMSARFIARVAFVCVATCADLPYLTRHVESSPEMFSL